MVIGNQPLRQAKLRELIFGGFTDKASKNPTSFLYQLALIPVALVMFLLPLIYVAIVCAVGYGVYYHAFHHIDIFESTGGGYTSAKLKFVLYVFPLMIGGILLVVMVKPFFARSKRREDITMIPRELEPLLYDFVDERNERQRQDLSPLAFISQFELLLALGVWQRNTNLH